jgi:transmembrane sensor
MVSYLLSTIHFNQMAKRINQTDLLNFLNGNCSAEESIKINQFLKTPYGQDFLNEFLQATWNTAEQVEINQKKLSQWKKEWALKFKAEKIKDLEKTVAEEQTRRIQLNTFVRYAAVLAVLVLGIVVYSISKRSNTDTVPDSKLIVKTNPLGRHSSFNLSDGTKIYLGPGSALIYPLKFEKNTRKVRLQGEAYFEVSKNKEKPFIIYTENIRTQVLGTTFKVSAFKDSPTMVAVTSGKVSVSRLKGNHIQESVYLLPGEQVACRPGSGIVKSTVNIQDIRNWTQGQLVFNGTPLSELVKQISRWYNVSIRIRSADLNQVPITVTIDGNMPVNKFLDVLSSSFGFSYAIENQIINIY